jgi:glyoxylase-like metal-dependent hydrolase (beta-lactamase superfamily II)
VRVLALDADLIVFVSAFWQTTCTVVRSGEEGFVIDSPVLPYELEALPQVLEQSQFPVSGLLLTHGDWDHLLARQAFPGASLGAGAPTASRLAAEPDRPQRGLTEFDDEHYVVRPEPLNLDEIQSLPVPGRLELGETGRELELHAAPGHTADGTAYLIPWLKVLVPGDYLSPVEIPWISESGSREHYLETLGRFDELLRRARTVVPGHGTPLDAPTARRILAEDMRYLQTLSELPPGRDTAAQRKIHAENLART